MRLENTDKKYIVMLAPMAGFSDRGMRMICRKYGMEYSTTEMVSAKAVVYGDKKTFSLAKISEDEGRVALQIFGSEPDIMARAAERLQYATDSSHTAPFAIDINMGCPVPKVYNNGEGSALMKNPELIYKIVKAVNESTDIPTTAKIRTGIDSGHINAVECARAIEEAGASMICIHGRTRAEMYSGKVNKEIIKNVKNSLHIPLIANGDIKSGADAVEMIRATGADGVAVGRGAVGNPFIFSEISSALSGRNYTLPSIDERVDAALLQLRYAVEDKGEGVAVLEARKQIAMYITSFFGSAKIRARINTATTYSEIEKILKESVMQ